ncbi:MAG: SMP-30/gluconolactonase/LRE family protein [Polyangiaceae bacterium]|nr:SMP-30/gluconolactonase/LRE family protein [Polyangiaceae bacterium]
MPSRLPYPPLLAAALTLLAAACSSERGTPAPEVGPPEGTLETFAELTGGSEGIAFAGDVLYAALTGRGLVRVQTDGTVEEFVEIPSPVGVSPGPGGKVLVCGKSEDTGEGVIWSVSAAGERSVLVRGATEPLALTNFVVVAPDGRLVFSDSGGDRVYVAESDGSSPRAAVTTVDYPNGLAFSEDGKTLYIASWSTETVYAASYDGGALGEPRAHVTGFKSVDGLVALRGGDLVLVTSGDGVLRVAPDGTARTLAPSSLLQVPANGALGTGEYGKRWLYVTNLLGRSIARVAVDGEGVPLR